MDQSQIEATDASDQAQDESVADDAANSENQEATEESGAESEEEAGNEADDKVDESANAESVETADEVSSPKEPDAASAQSGDPIATRVKAEASYNDAMDKLKQFNEGKLEIPRDKRFKDPDYRPESYDEVVEEATRRAEAKAEMKQQIQADVKRAAEALVNAQFAEIKAKDKSVTLDGLLGLANEYGFKDLYQAHKLHTKLAGVKVQTEKRVVGNVAKRKVESVAGNGGSQGGGEKPGMTYADIRRSTSILDAVHRAQGK